MVVFSDMPQLGVKGKSPAEIVKPLMSARGKIKRKDKFSVTAAQNLDALIGKIYATQEKKAGRL